MILRFNPIAWSRKTFRDSNGQTLVEYALLLVLIAVVVILAVTYVGQQANNSYNNIGAHLPAP